jgi:hypothetical protein
MASFKTINSTKNELYSLPSNTMPSAISLLKTLTATKKRLILSADHHSPYEGTDAPWSYCIPMTESYAKLIGVDFKFELIKDSIRGRHSAWSKIALLSKYVNMYDEIMWFDSDSTVVNHKVNVFDYIKAAPLSKNDASNQPILYTMSDQTGEPCTNIFLLDCSNKQTALDLLEQWWANVPDKTYEITCPWDQSVWKAWMSNGRASYIRIAVGTSKVDGHKDQVFAHIGTEHGIVRTYIAKKYFNRQLQPKHKRIGILVRQQNYYTNGCGQNCIFMMQSFESMGYWVDLLVDYESDKPDKVSDAIPYSYTKIADANFEDYEVIIFGSKLPSAHDNKRMKQAGVRRIVFNPTNVVDQLHNEHFLYKCRESTLPVQEMTYVDIADEVWIIDSHKDTTLTYMEVINKNKIPVRAVPHIWSPLFLKDKDGSISMNKPCSRKQLDIIIMEPNLGYCKSGWLPLVICEKLCLEQPDLIHQVFLFGAPAHPTAVGMMESLQIWKLKKLRIMGRIPITNIFSFFSNVEEHGDFMPVFLSNSINSPLNYAYFDALYAGFPLVHNSNSLKKKGLGYHYDNVSEGANAVIKARDTFDLEESTSRSRKVLDERNPYDKNCVSEFSKIVAKVDNPLILPNTHEPTLVIVDHYHSKKCELNNLEVEKKKIKQVDTHDDGKPIVITYDNMLNTNSSFFLETLRANSWNYNHVGNGEVWRGFLNKLHGYNNAVKSMPPNTVVILSDSRDVVCTRSPDAFLEGFATFGDKIVISMELFCEGHMTPDKTSGFQCIPLTKYWNHCNYQHKPNRQFCNSGLIAGRAKDLCDMLTWIIENNYTDDQLGVCNYMNTFPEKVYGDVNAELLHTSSYGVVGGVCDLKIQSADSPTFSELLGQSSFFLHIPGHGISKGQKFIYESVCSTLKLLNNKKMKDVYNRQPTKWNEKNNVFN